MRNIAVLLGAAAMNLVFVLDSAAPQSVVLPPSKYDKPLSSMIVWHYAVGQVDNICGRLLARVDTALSGGQVLGCAIGSASPRCIIIVPKRGSVSAEAYDSIYRHERGHCNGWHH